MIRSIDSHLGRKSIPCELGMPTMIGVICPVDRLTVPTKLITRASLGDEVMGWLGTQTFEQTENTAEALSATSRHPLEDVGQTVWSTSVPTVRTLIDWDAVPTLWMNRRASSACDINTRSPCGSVVWESASVRFRVTVDTGGWR